MTAPFNPPAADLAGKPKVTPWVPPPTSKLDIDWAKLRTIDLSILDNPDPTVVQDLVDTCRVAIRDDGFIFLEHYGISIEQLHRQFDIAQYLHQHISDEDKERLHWNPDESGTFAGWKPMWGWRSKNGPVGQGYFRQALYYASDDVVHAKGKGTRMNGHCDFGTTTMLFSVPISSLQIWGRDEQWRYVPYKPGSLVINIGETLELVSGGHFRATRHRVVDPPADQLSSDRLSLVLFQASEGDLRMEPAYQSPLLQREGCFDSQGAYREFKRLRERGVPIPTNRQWREVQIADAHHPTDAAPNDKIVVKEGKRFIQREYLGVNILLPA
ncbi:uncharacterized protein IL334_007964 [Kwoniella shivajii]|uniref:Fe2OG dioxygenase domain-containing protein n=1 Tax=Kwoniella shivajii TaxID=564305 RepID=A0ABZ1DAR0_9TREE|nr:hypothetical protein IL334_007964 [Kwoniella shivajii]